MTISQEQIREHTRLINSLNALDYVPAALEDNAARLKVVCREATKKQKELADLEKKTKSEFKDVRKLQSPARRFVIRLSEGGKDAVNARVQKEEQEYLEAFRKEREARDELEMILGEKREREAASADLAEKEIHIKECKEKIDALYEGLFAGPTPEYPEEEEAEQWFMASQFNYNNIQIRINRESTALMLLVRAEKALRLCITKATEARVYAMEVVLGTNMFSDLLESNTLLGATLDAAMTKNFLRQAEEALCAPGTIGSIGDLHIPKNHPTYDVVGTEYVKVRDTEFPKKLDEGIKALQESHTRLQGELSESHQRIAECELRVRQLTKEMQTRRKKLAKVRCEIMIRIADPATIEAHPHASAQNAHEVGDADLPTYVDPSAAQPTHANGSPTTMAVPTYEQAQAQQGTEANTAGGFRMTFTSQPNSTPRDAPPGFGPAPGPGGIGGFRAMTEMPSAPSGGRRPSLSLRLPEPQVNGNSRISLSPLLMPTTPLTPSTPSSPLDGGLASAGPRPMSWSHNPYASAMIRQASISEQEPTPPGGWRVETNPFAGLVEEPNGVEGARNGNFIELVHR